MAYRITQRQRNTARRLGVQIKTSSTPSKKIDVYKNNKKLVSIGAKGYSDYDTYLRTHGKKYADERRRLYKIRHENNRHKKGTAGYYADKILW